MSSFINPAFDEFKHTFNNKTQQFFYHHPSQAKMSGWAVALGACLIHETFAVAGIVEAVALGIINGIGAAFCESCRPKFRAALKQLTRFTLVALFAIPRIVVDTIKYWNQPAENQRKVKEWGWKDIHFAAYNNDITYLQELLKKDPLCCDLRASETVYSDTPLHLAVRMGNEAAIRVLKDAGANLSVRNTIEFTPLDYAVVTLKPKMVHLLAELGADMNARNKYGYAPIHHAVMEIFEMPGWGSVEFKRENFGPVIQALAANKADLNARASDRLKSTALTLAAASDKPVAVRALLKVKADANLKTEDGLAAIHYATKRCRQEVLKLLTDDPAVDVNIKDSDGWTPLHFTAVKYTSQIAEQLAAVPRVNRNAQDGFGRTAYQIAYQRQVVLGGNAPAVNYLRSVCDVTLKDSFGKLPEEYDRNSSFGTETLFERVGKDFQK